MKDLNKEINVLFDLCEKTNLALRSVDGYAQHKLMAQVKKQSSDVFILLENKVNPMGVKDLSKDIQDRKTLLKLCFVILKSLYMFSKSGVSKFEDARCEGSTLLAYKMLKDMGFETKFGQSQTWINNDIIYDNVFLEVVSHLHPTNMQSLVRCLAATLVYPEVKNQKIPDYMIRFEGYILYFLMQSPPDERIYLDFI